jgi:ElaB/YqjD/DUF883 family membrane-anchored ribosome-binding protein
MRPTKNSMNRHGLRAAATWAAPLAAMALVISCPALATSSMSGAERLHRLDVMLKVSSARCSGDASDLRADYADFVRNHRFALSEARRELGQQFTQRYGAAGADAAYERMNYRLADEYRRQHPWLSCAELKTAAHGLAVVDGSATLLEAADQILPESAARHLASNRRD